MRQGWTMLLLLLLPVEVWGTESPEDHAYCRGFCSARYMDGDSAGEGMCRCSDYLKKPGPQLEVPKKRVKAEIPGPTIIYPSRDKYFESYE